MIDRKTHASFEAGVNRVYVRLGNEPMPTMQRSVGTRLLSPFENRHFNNLKHVAVTHSNYKASSSDLDAI